MSGAAVAMMWWVWPAHGHLSTLTGATWSAPYPVTLPRRDSMPCVPQHQHGLRQPGRRECSSLIQWWGNHLRLSGGGRVRRIAEGRHLTAAGHWPETVWALGDHCICRVAWRTAEAIDPGFNGVASAGAMSAAPIVSTPSPSAVVIHPCISEASSVTGTASAGAHTELLALSLRPCGTARRANCARPAASRVEPVRVLTQPAAERTPMKESLPAMVSVRD